MASDGCPSNIWRFVIESRDYASSIIFVRDFAVTVALGMILLLSLSKLIGRVQFSFSTAFWCSMIGHMFISIISFVTGFFFPQRAAGDWATTFSAIAVIVGFVIACILQAGFFQIAVRVKNQILIAWRAFTLSLIVILGDFFLVSPLIELWQRFRT